MICSWSRAELQDKAKTHTEHPLGYFVSPPADECGRKFHCSPGEKWHRSGFIWSATRILMKTQKAKPTASSRKTVIHKDSEGVFCFASPAPTARSLEVVPWVPTTPPAPTPSKRTVLQAPPAVDEDDVVKKTQVVENNGQDVRPQAVIIKLRSQRHRRKSKRPCSTKDSCHHACMSGDAYVRSVS